MGNNNIRSWKIGNQPRSIAPSFVERNLFMPKTTTRTLLVSFMLSAAMMLVVCGSSEADTRSQDTWPHYPFHPYLHWKALTYDEGLRLNHTTGLGGVTDVLYTDETRTEMLSTKGAGDSTDWTTFYMVSQCLRYRITGDAIALEEVERIAWYLHLVHTVTQHPGYLARYVGYDQAPWNVENLGGDNRHEGYGEFEGLFWLGHQSRDKFMHWFWGMAWAYDTVTDEELRQTIRDDMDRIARTLRDQNWKIIDPWGDTWPAANLGPDIRLEIMVATAHTTGDPFWWEALDQEFDKVVDILPIAMFHFFNQYFDYYAFINDIPVSNTIFRLWPDKERLQRFYDAWMWSTRKYTQRTHYALMDVVHYGGCLRLGVCDPAEVEYMRRDVRHGLFVFWNPPNYQRYVECPELPLDPFSVWAAGVIEENPWIGDLITIRPQTAKPHRIEDRCWQSHLWEGGPYHVECTKPENPARVAPGDDYTLAYWFGVYYGLLAGDGPYEEMGFAGED